MTRRQAMNVLLRIQNHILRQLNRAQQGSNAAVWDAIGITQLAFWTVFHDTDYMAQADVEVSL